MCDDAVHLLPDVDLLLLIFLVHQNLAIRRGKAYRFLLAACVNDGKPNRRGPHHAAIDLRQNFRDIASIDNLNDLRQVSAADFKRSVGSHNSFYDFFGGTAQEFKRSRC